MAYHLNTQQAPYPTELADLVTPHSAGLADSAALLNHLLAKSRREDACLVWTGTVTKSGYGRVKCQGKQQSIHRLAWEIWNESPIPDGLFVCHTCDNPPCWQKEHLFLGTALDNMLDKVAKGRWRGGHPARAHCKRGHLFDDVNTYFRPGGGRACRTCVRESARRSRTATRVFKPE